MKSYINKNSIFQSLLNIKTKKNSISVEEQLFDEVFLKLSPSYKASRQIYLDLGGTFEPSFVSKKRYLNQKKLLNMHIEYNPIHSDFKISYSEKNEAQIEYLLDIATPIFRDQNKHIFNKIFRGHLTTKKINLILNSFDQVFKNEIEKKIKKDISIITAFI